MPKMQRKKVHVSRRFAVLVLAATVCLAGCVSDFKLQSEFEATDRVTPEIREVVAKYRASIPRTMQKHNIPGTSVALVDREQILWAAGFGYTDTDRKTPVTPETIFSIQSMSKTFTGTAVMFAVQDGLLDLNAPITEYVPNFRVNSRFEEHPERKITLKHLLSHTAGFTHEAPVGNNCDTLSPSFDEHVRSISNTWLKFPVGQKYSYSNLGIDLAGYILQVRSGKSLTQYMKEKIFDPLNMPNSSMDMDVIRRNTNRAIGHQFGVEKVPVEIPMVAAGGVYTNARELCRFVQFHLNRGKINGKRILDETLLDTMYGIPDGRTLAIGKAQKYNSYCLAHGGGGFGFLTNMIWYPEYGIGAIELTNTADHKIQGQISRQILDDIIERTFAARSNTAQPKQAERQKQDTASRKTKPEDGSSFTPTPYIREWAKYTGTYTVILRGWKLKWYGEIAKALGHEVTTVKVRKKGSYLLVNDEKLQEHEPGLFFTPSGEALDFRSEIPTWQNIKLKKLW